MIKKLCKSFAGLFIAITIISSLTAITAFAAEAKLSRTSVSVTQGKTTTLKVSGAAGDVKWSSSDRDIAIVSKGVVKGVSPGTATITASAGETKLTCKVTVATNKIIPQSDKVSITAGTSGYIDITVKGVPDAVSGTTDKTVATSSLDIENNRLRITGHKEGTAKIKVFSKSDSKISRTITVTVKKAPPAGKGSLQGTVSNEIYKNEAYNMKFAWDGFIFIDFGDIGFDTGVDSVVPMFMGVTPDFEVIMAMAVDISEYSDAISDNFISEYFSTMAIAGFSQGFTEGSGIELGAGKLSEVTISGTKYEVITYEIDGSYMSMAFKNYNNSFVMIMYVSEDNDFSEAAKHFTVLN